MSAVFRSAAATVLCLLLAPMPSLFAQDVSDMPAPRAEVSSGYMLMRDVTRDTGKTYPAGWYISGVYNVTPWLGIVAEGSAGYGRTEEVNLATSQYSSKPRMSTITAGARFFHKAGRFAPYGQFLMGAAIEQRKHTDVWNGVAHSGTTTANRLALQPGGGVTVYITERVGFRAAADVLFSDDIEENDVDSYVRFLTGFTLQWGGR